MADYTYATASGKAYDDFIKRSQERAAEQAAAYAQRVNAANERYKADINAIYDGRIKAQEATAAADADKIYASYATQFDANAASQLARERHLKEQMANYGLTESGYNATNQAALAAARSNADATTRTARGQALDAVAADLREHKASAEEARANALAQGDRAAAERVMDAEQTLQKNVHGEAMDLLDYAYKNERDAAEDAQWAKEQALKQQELDHKAEKDAQYADRMMKEYVDEHNSEVYRLMLDAYKSGNAALAEAYAKTLWQVDENGIVVPTVMDTSAATKYTEQQNAFEQKMQQMQQSQGTSKKESPQTGYDNFGFPYKYYDYITEARDTMRTLSQTGYNPAREYLTNRAMNLLYMIRQETRDEGAEGYMDEATFEDLLRYVGVKANQYLEYERYVNGYWRNPDKEALRAPTKGATAEYDR